MNSAGVASRRGVSAGIHGIDNSIIDWETSISERSTRNFGRLLVASAASNLADGALQTVMPLVALGITRDPGAFATVTLVGRLPWLLFALPAGALADRLDRRRTMVLVDAGRVVVLGALTLVVAAGREELWMLCAVAFALGCGETLFDTAAQSILPSLVAGRTSWSGPTAGSTPSS